MYCGRRGARIELQTHDMAATQRVSNSTKADCFIVEHYLQNVLCKACGCAHVCTGLPAEAVAGNAADNKVPTRTIYLQSLVVHEGQALTAALGDPLGLSGVLCKAHAHITDVGHATYFGVQILQPVHCHVS